MIGLNLNDIYSYTGSIYHMINHALFKSALFLCAGMIARVYGTKDIYKLRGVLRRMPLVGAAMIMAVLGITGTPLLNGSVSKYFIVSGAGLPVTIAIIFINLGTIITFIRYSSILFGDPGARREKIEWYKQAVIIALGVISFAGGIFGEQTITFLFGIDVSVDAAGYWEKAVLFTLSLAAGFLIYRYVIKRGKPLLERMRRIEFGFRGICVLMGLFFALLLISSFLF
jgi:multicomponent Na+:H+ antiporter subunit D